MSYLRASDSYIKYNVNSEMIESIYIPLFNLSAILGDIDGKVSKSDALLIKQHVNLVTPGVVIGDFSSSPFVSDVVTPSQFILRVSNYSFLLYQDIRNNNYEIVSELTTLSPMLSNINLLSSKLSSALCLIFLEVLSVYKCLLAATTVEGIAPLSRRDFEILSSNIRWLSYHVELNNTLNLLDLISVLRDAQRNIDYIASMNDLFNSTYNSKLQEYQQIVSGGY